MRTSPSDGPGSFRTFEQAGWQDVATRYHHAFGDLTSQAIEPLLDVAGVCRGVRVLDVASGPGYAAAAAARREARVVGVDFASAMVAAARRRYPDLEFQEGDAEDLPFAEGSFDAVVMNFGLLHLGRPERALAEAARVLRSGGRVAFTVWVPPPETAGFDIVLRAVKECGNPDVPLPPGPPFFRYSEPEASNKALIEAGLIEPASTRVPQVWRLPSPEALFEVMQDSTVRTAGLLRAQSAEALRAIGAAIVEAAGAYAKGGAIELPMPAVLCSAVKP